MSLRKKISWWVAAIIGLGMPLYYKAKFLLLGQISLDQILNWTLPLEFAFGILLALVIIMAHDSLVNHLRTRLSNEQTGLRRFLYQYLISSALAILTAVLFSILFWDYIMGMPITKEYIFDYAILGLLIPVLLNGVTESLYFYGQWEKENSEKIELEKENIRTRYELLQNQLNPHFLFNCFNTLNVLIVESRKAAADFLQHLSQVYRYVLEIKEQELVSLKTELQSLLSFDRLMRFRFGDTYRLHLDVNSDQEQLYLAPLTLQMLLENALKHNHFSKESPLDIRVSLSKDRLLFSNDLRKKTKVQGTGTGLRNLQQRYAYLSTADLVLEATGQFFHVSVPLIQVEAL